MLELVTMLKQNEKQRRRSAPCPLRTLGGHSSGGVKIAMNVLIAPKRCPWATNRIENSGLGSFLTQKPSTDLDERLFPDCVNAAGKARQKW